jgi:transporter family protein
VIVAAGATVVLVRCSVASAAAAADRGAAVATAAAPAGLVFDEGHRAGTDRGGRAVRVLTMLLFAILTVILADPIRAFGWLPVVVGSRIANMATAFVLLAIGLRSDASRFGRSGEVRPRTWDRTGVLLVVIAGVFDIVAFAAYAIGLEVADVWLVGLASSFGPVVAIGFAVWRLGERLRPSQWLGVALIAVGVVVLAVAG